MIINVILKGLDYLVWIDEDNISGDVLTSMASAVENAFVVLFAVNDQYFQSRYCRLGENYFDIFIRRKSSFLEAEYSVEQNKESIPMLMQTGYKPGGWLGLINGAKLYIDFSQFPFDQAFNLLIREIEVVRMKLGAEKNTRLTSKSSF